MHFYEPQELNEPGFEEHSQGDLTDYHHESERIHEERRHHNHEHHDVYRGIHIKPIAVDYHDYVHNMPLF